MSHSTDRFDSATIEIINIAIEDAWREIQNAGGPLARPFHEELLVQSSPSESQKWQRGANVTGASYRNTEYGP